MNIFEESLEQKSQVVPRFDGALTYVLITKTYFPLFASSSLSTYPTELLNFLLQFFQ
jgi:hypothetical protein